MKELRRASKEGKQEKRKGKRERERIKSMTALILS